MASAEQYIVMSKQGDTYKEVARPTVTDAFSALEATDPGLRGPEMYVVPASAVCTFILVPQDDRPTQAELVRALPDGSLTRPAPADIQQS